MIIKYPTGLYHDQMPTFLSSTNVTYNISNNAPARSNIFFITLPTGEQIKTYDGREILPTRDKLGDLVFTVSTAKGNNAQSGQKIYEVGQVLEFGDIDVAIYADKITSDISDLSHNLYYLDFTKLGLGDSDVTVINQAIQASFDAKTADINGLKRQAANKNVTLLNLTKQNSDTIKAIAALELANGTGALTDYIAKLKSDLAANQNTAKALDTEIAALQLLISSDTDALRSLGALLK